MSVAGAIHEGGFGSPVFETQAIFRTLMTALAKPAVPRPFPALTAPPAPFPAGLGAVALTLCDHDTPVWLSASLAARRDIAAWLAFHGGIACVADTAAAAFAFVADGDGWPDIAALAQGTDAYPDRSATLVCAVPAFTGGRRFSATGPGIASAVSFALKGLPDGFADAWAMNGARFPCGVDLILVAPGAVLGLPRTTRLEPMES